jgi:hypothetical protein
MGGLAPSSKPKLASFLSFPIGAEAINVSLKDVPQFSSLELVFSADPILSATNFRRLIEADEPHVVLRARFERWDKKPSIGDASWVQEYLHGKWSLWVYPVRRQLKAQAREAVLTRGLPKIAEWLSLDRPSSWYFGRKICEMVFVPKENAIRIEESIEAT